MAVLKCRDVPDLATDYMEGDLPRRARIALRMHLLICSMCRAYLDQLRKTRSFLGRQAMPAPAQDVEDRLVGAGTDRN
jgi:predicted anti-sigma-YlaC factor YlaD